MPFVHGRPRSAALTVLGLLATLGMLYLCSGYLTERYYAEALRLADTHETVTVRDRTYVVDNGTVSRDGKAVTGIAAWEPRTLAYEVTLTRRNPLFGIAGTNPDQLAKSVDQLQSVEDRLSALQKTDGERNAMHSLYPLHFLRTLAALEEKRQAFLAEPSDVHADAYERYLPAVLDAKQKDLANFRVAFSLATASTSVTSPLFSGVLTTQSELASIQAYVDDASAARQRLDAHAACLKAAFWRCTESIAAPQIPAVSTSNTPPPTYAPQIESLWQDAFGTTGNPARLRVALAQSSCLSAFKPPYTVSMGMVETPLGPATNIAYSDALFFVSTDNPRAPVLHYLRTTYGMDYTPYNPLKYYTCPQIGIDIGSLRAVVHTADFASTHLSLAVNERHQLLQDPTHIKQQDTLSYISVARSEALAQSDYATAHLLDELALMNVQKTAGLELLVDDIYHVGTTDAQPYLVGIMDSTASTIFLTHSAFPSFYRIGAASDPPLNALYITDATSTAKFIAHFEPYDTLRTMASRESLVHDLRAFLIFENIIPATTSASAPAAIHP